VTASSEGQRAEPRRDLPPAEVSLPVPIAGALASAAPATLPDLGVADGVVPAASRGLGPAGLADSLVGPLVQQFAAMQQQMFEQFQHTVVMLAQTFGALHRDQLTLIRQEMDRLHRLSEELTILRTEQARHLPPPPHQALAPGAATGNGIRAESAAPRSRSSPADNPRAATGPSRANGGGAAAELRSALATGGGPPDAPTLPRAPSGVDGSDEAIHIWIQERIAAIQKERQTRWQKILTSLLGN
jgi:hypothetical protein